MGLLRFCLKSLQTAKLVHNLARLSCIMSTNCTLEHITLTFGDDLLIFCGLIPCDSAYMRTV